MYSLGPRTVSFIGDYLKEHIQQVAVGEVIPSLIEVISGVPQGSCLGPVLFSLFVNDLPSSIYQSFLKLFANNVKVYLPIKNLTEVQLIQEDLDSLTQWRESNIIFYIKVVGYLPITCIFCLVQMSLLEKWCKALVSILISN